MEDRLNLCGSYCLTLVDGETVWLTESERGLECNSLLDLKYLKDLFFFFSPSGDIDTAPFYAVFLGEI